MIEAALSLGSNMGNRIHNIKNAVNAIDGLPETKIVKISKYYETEPFGVPDKQEKYINCCVKVVTALLPRDLLESCLKIEENMGRTREYRFCPRVIDIDILIYGRELRNEEGLILPHPRFKERAFVLAPLKDISKNMVFGDINFEKNYNACDLSTVKQINC